MRLVVRRAPGRDRATITSFALNAAAADGLSEVLLTTHTVEDDPLQMPDPSQNETSSVIDPASLTLRRFRRNSWA